MKKADEEKPEYACIKILKIILHFRHIRTKITDYPFIYIISFLKKCIKTDFSDEILRNF